MSSLPARIERLDLPFAAIDSGIAALESELASVRRRRDELAAEAASGPEALWHVNATTLAEYMDHPGIFDVAARLVACGQARVESEYGSLDILI